MKNKLLIFLLLLSTSIGFSQHTLNNGANGTVSACSGTFLDNGGSAGNYTNNSDGTITFCPPTAGDLIRISFTSFNTEDDGTGGCYDYLDFWNGNTVGAVGTQDIRFCGPMTPFEITSTSPDGCVSFRFISDFSVTSSGWSANISCITPCTPPVAALADTTTLDICNPNADNPGSLNVAFDASGSTATSGQNIVSYEWNFGDGTTVTTATATTTHTYPSNSGVYIASVSVRDDNTVQDPLGCSSVNSTSKIIRVMPGPDFSGTPDSYNVSCGDSVTLTGVVSSQTETQEIPMLTPATMALPDGTGVSFSSTIDFTGFFAPGATLTSGCYPTVSFDLEHSAAQDLEIKLIAPTGEEVVLYNRGGDPIEFTGFGTCANAADDAVPGCTASYSVVGDNSGIGWDTPASETTATVTCAEFAGPCENPGFFGYYYVPTTYNSDSPFTSIDGASLNGMWTLEITDHEINDDGVLKTWGLDFPQACYSLETVTPDLTTATWTGGGPALPVQNTTSTGVTDPGPDTCPTPGTCTGNELTNSPTVGPFLTPGTSTYTITVVDEFGCEYHKDVTVTASCACLLTLDTANNDQTVCENTAIADIVYTVGGDATGATVTGLPTGVTGTYLAGVLTISGTPTTAVGSPFTYTVTTVGCTPELTATGTLTVNAIPDIPTITTTAPTCVADGTSTINPYDNTLTYTFTPAGPTIGAGGIINNMTIGTSYTVNASNSGCTSAESAAFTNDAMLVTPAVPTVDTTAPTCVADGTSTINPYDNTLTYTFTPAGPTIGAGGIINNMTIGTSYTVNVSDGSCTSTESAAFTNNAMLVTPAVPTINTTAPTCVADGTSTINPYDNTLTYTFTPAGPTIGAGGIINNMTIGTSYTVNVSDGTCTSTESAAFTNDAMLATLAAPIVDTTAPTCVADGTSTINPYDNTLTYTFTPAGPTIGAGGIINNMTIGTSYTVNVSDGSCTSTESAAFTNNAMLVTPAVPTVNTTAPTCVADGTSTINPYDNTLTYTFTPAGPTIGAGGIINNMTIGTSYTVNVSDGSCTSTESAAFTNNAMLVTPAVPTVDTTAPTCVADGTSTINPYDNTLTYTFTPAGPTIGAGGIINNMTIGTSYTVNVSDGTCTSTESAAFTNNAMLVTPAVPTLDTTAPTCVADGTSTINPYDNTLTYTFTPAGPTIGAGGIINNMTIGTSYTVNVSDGSCTSTESAAFTNNAMLATLAAPIVDTTAPTCVADGTSTINPYDNSLTYTFTPAGPTIGAGGIINNMTIGTSYTVNVSDGSCTSAESAAFTNDAMLVTPAVPTITTTAATCSADGTSTISNYDGTVTYAFTPAGPSVAVGGAISGMTTGTSYTVNASNGSCTSAESVAFTNNAMLAITGTPVASVTEQPTCTNSFGTITVTSPTLTANEEYVLEGPDATGTIQTNTTDGIFTNLASGDYTLYISDTVTGCISNSIILTVDTVTVIPSFDLNNACDGVDYTISVNNPNSNYTYNWYDSTGTLIGSGEYIIVTQADTYEVQATLGTCIATEYITINNAFCSIPKGLSPNGDGLNDTWELSNLDVKQVKIYNRYGTEVYSKSDYTNEWDGTSDKGNELPDATYYYVIWFNNDKTTTGWVYINR